MPQGRKAPLLHRVIRKILEILFNLLYYQLAWSYDLVAWVVSGGLWKSWVLSILPYLNEGNILELGYGPGHLQEAGLRANKNMFGIDLSPSMVKICSSRLKNVKLTSKIMRANSLYLPFPSESFSQVTATFPSPYIFSPQALTEINRILKPRGELLIIPTAWSTSKSIFQKFFSWLLNISNKTNDEANNNLSQILKPFTECGFEVNQQEIEIKASKVLLLKATKVG